MADVLPAPTAFFRVPGRRLALSTLEKGSGTTLVFVHGLGGNRQQWRLQWERFSQANVNLVAWDAYGHGESARSPHEQAFLSTYAVEDLAAILKTHPSSKRILVAHSFGCRVTLELIAGLLQAGETVPVDELILLGPASLAPSLKGPMFGNWMDRLPFWLASFARPFLQKRFEALAWGPNVDSAILKTERKATKRNSLFMINAVRSGAQPVDTEILRQIGKPVHILAGQQDGIVPLAEIQKIHNLIPGSSLDVLSDCGHQIMLEQPTIVNHVIESALNRFSSGQDTHS
ncbi:alpha/beta hydrolase [Gluconobacter frateurii]|uniref:alpha/beta fold hydrolase n=1 Tax=Gluconobacter frateurii TaxID=38308 RepID=UPI001F070870|nr:alpha/beta hydrolase [Gluconobacter frateurii]UMM08218.1 alpha/beta hydrolase [Gluconobacter frateurii]